MGFSVNEFHLCERSVSRVAAPNGAFIFTDCVQRTVLKTGVSNTFCQHSLGDWFAVNTPFSHIYFFLLSFAYAKQISQSRLLIGLHRCGWTSLNWLLMLLLIALSVFCSAQNYGNPVSGCSVLSCGYGRQLPIVFWQYFLVLITEVNVSFLLLFYFC